MREKLKQEAPWIIIAIIFCAIFGPAWVEHRQRVWGHVFEDIQEMRSERKNENETD